MKPSISLRLRAFAAIFAILSIATVSVHAERNPDSLVFPVDAKPYGASYGEWSARWWQWVYAIPTDENPLLDLTGANCDVAQSGNVWFLAGVAIESGTAERNCTVPSGTALFFPILNYEADTFSCGAEPPRTIEELRAEAKNAIDVATDLSTTIDGVTITGLQPYRVTSPVFALTLPADNVISELCEDEPAGTYSPIVSDGYYLMVKPLSVGEHTIHFHGAIPEYFALDITYHLTVVPRGQLDQG